MSLHPKKKFRVLTHYVYSLGFFLSSFLWMRRRRYFWRVPDTQKKRYNFITFWVS